MKADTTILVFNLDAGHSVKVTGRRVMLCYTETNFYTNESHARESDISGTEIGRIVLRELERERL